LSSLGVKAPTFFSRRRHAVFSGSKSNVKKKPNLLKGGNKGQARGQLERRFLKVATLARLTRLLERRSKARSANQIRRRTIKILTTPMSGLY
jgi:hypothetical protein